MIDTTVARPLTDQQVVASRRRRRVFSPRNIVLGVILIGLTVIFAIPMLFMISTSLKSPEEANALQFQLIPDQLTTQAYSAILNNAQRPIVRWLLNSLLTAVLHSALVVFLATTAAYALARMEFRGKRVIFTMIILTMFVPGVIFLIPHFLIVNQLGWLDSYASLVVPSAAGAFGVFFLRQFFLNIHPSLEEAARIDGCNRWTIFVRIMLPLAKPSIATLAVLSFLTSWNDFLWPVFVLFSSEMQTLPAGLALLQGQESTRYDLLMAGAVIASVPVLIIYVIAQRYIIEGVAQGGVKG